MVFSVSVFADTLTPATYPGFRCVSTFGTHSGTEIRKLELIPTGQVSPHSERFFNLVFTPTYNDKTQEPNPETLATRLVPTYIYEADPRVVTLVTPNHGSAGTFFVEVTVKKVTEEVARLNLQKMTSIQTNVQTTLQDANLNHHKVQDHPDRKIIFDWDSQCSLIH